jgi:hypothetical protein
MKISLDSIKRRLQSRSCPEHNQKAKVTIIDDQLHIAACCDKFKASLTKVVALATAEPEPKPVS